MTGSRCGTTAPGFSIFSIMICAESMKRLRRKGFVFRGELLFQLYNAFTKYLLQQIRHPLRRLNRGNH